MKIILGLFLMGFSFGWGPCLVSCGPVLISYLSGTKKDVRSSAGTYVLFSLARISVYILLGLLVFSLGRFVLQRYLGALARYIFISGGIFIILLGMLTALGRHLDFKSCKFLEKTLIQKYNASAILLGLIIAFVPCLPLLALLGYVGLVSKTWSEVFLYCFSFGLGTAISPLAVLSVMSGLISRFWQGPKEAAYRIFSFICGLIMIFLGAGLIFRAR